MIHVERCAACGGLVESPCAHGEGHAIHRDGHGVGPEVLICCGCGAYETPSCEELWKRIRERADALTSQVMN